MIRRIRPLGLAAILWFAALFQAAYDLWAACLVFLAVTLLISLHAWKTSRHPVPLKLPLAPQLFFIWGALWLSVMRAYDMDSAILEAWGWTFAFCIFYLVLNTLESLEDWDWFLKCSAMVLVPLAMICVWQQCTRRPDSWGHWEIEGTLINSLVLAGFTLCWVFFLWEKAWEGGRLSIVLLLSSFIILGLARSSWAFISLFAGFLFYYRELGLRWVRQHKRLGLGCAALAAAFLAAVVVVKIRVHVGPYKGSSRSFYWLAALKIWKAAPWTGVGLGGFATAYPYVRDPRVQSTLFAHSFILQWLSETGLVGMLGLGGLGFGILKILHHRPPDPLRGNKKEAFKATLVAVLLFSLLSINLEYLLNKILLLILLAAAIRSRPMPSYRVKPLWMGTFSLGLWLLSVFWLRMFLGSQAYARGSILEQQGRMDLAQKEYETASSIDPLLAESDHALSKIYWLRFLATGAPEARETALEYLAKAITHHRRLDYVMELRHDASQGNKPL